MKPPKLRQHIHIAGYTYATLAAELHVAASTVGQWARGECMVSPKHVRRVAFLLDVDPEVIVPPEKEEAA